MVNLRSLDRLFPRKLEYGCTNSLVLLFFSFLFFFLNVIQISDSQVAMKPRLEIGNTVHFGDLKLTNWFFNVDQDQDTTKILGDVTKINNEDWEAKNLTKSTRGTINGCLGHKSSTCHWRGCSISSDGGHFSFLLQGKFEMIRPLSCTGTQV